MAKPRNAANVAAATSAATTDPQSSSASRYTATTVRHAQTKNVTRIASRSPTPTTLPIATASAARYAAPGVFWSKMLT